MNFATRLFLLFFLVAMTHTGLAHQPKDEGAGDKPLCVNITSIVITPENCGQGNGTITVTHDGTAPFMYTWTGTVSSTNMATGLSAGNYTFKVEDAAGCDAETMLVVTETLPPVLQVTSTIHGGCDNGGFATVSSSDPTASGVWSTNPQQTGFMLNDVAPGVYTLTVTDSVGCQSLINAILDPPDAMSLGVTHTADTCGSEDGTAIVDVLVSGFPPFTYLWDDPSMQTTRTPSGLAAGTYEVLVTDATGCEARETVVIPLIDQLNIEVDFKEPTCFGDDDGWIEIKVTGGNGPYNFNWNPDVSRSNRANNLTSGTYNVTISDALGEACTTTEVIQLAQESFIALNIGTERSSDCGKKDASAWVSPDFVQGPYTVVWDTFGTGVQFGMSDTLKNIYPGIYIVKVVDSAGCDSRARIVVTSKDEITVTVDVQQEDDCGLGEGIARAQVVGGTRPFRYQWFTFPIDQDPTSPFAYNLEQGRFFVVVSDANDCVNIDFFNMPGRPPLELVNTNTTDNYCDLANGSARATFEGGTPPYNYEWSTLPVQTSQTALGLPEGPYRVVITDQRNCKDTAVIFVRDQAAFDITTSATPITCFGDENGTTTVNIANGGLAPFRIEWSSNPPQFSPQASNLPEGKYIVSVEDAAGCKQSAFAVVNGAAPVSADFSYNPDTLRPVILSKAAFSFGNQSHGAEDYLWDFGDGNTSDHKSPVHVYKDTGQFYVTLKAFSNNELCSDEKTHGPFIVISPGTAFIPSAFTPNSDGINDELAFGGVFLESFDFQLFDRWGKLVWAASSVNDKWDGQFADGSSAPEGVYVFTMRAIGVDRVLFEKQGTITLFR